MKKYLPFFICVFVGIFLARFYLPSGMPFTHDGENHLARFANYKLALKQGQFPPRWAPNLVHGYGYPVFHYNYPLANILSLPFSIIKVPYEVTFRIIVVLSMVSLAVGAWIWIHQKERPFSTELLAICSLAASPVLVSLLAFRGSIGEMLALAILPWGLWSEDRLLSAFSRKSKSQNGILSPHSLLFTVLLSALLLSHNVTVLMAIPIFAVYTVFHEHWNGRQLALLTLLVMWAVGVTAWFWFPALLERGAIVLNGSDISQQTQQHALTVSELFFSPSRFGFSYPGNVDSAALSMGIFQILILVLATISFGWEWRFGGELNQRARQRKARSALLIAWMVTVAQLNFFAGLWKYIPFSQFIQFPWRLALLQTLFLLPVIGYFWPAWPRPIQRALVVLLLIQIVGLSRVYPVDRFTRVNASYEEFAQSTSTANENLPKTFTLTEFPTVPRGPLFLSSQGSAEVKQWNGSDHEYTLKIEKPGIILESTADFLGWQTTITPEAGTPFIAKYENSPEIAGRIAFSLPQPGIYTVHTQFTQRTPIRQISNAISLLTSLALLMTAAVVSRKSWQRKMHVTA